jgi:uroporphyrinogen decarboxylase
MKPTLVRIYSHPIRTIQDVEKVIVPDVHVRIRFDAIKLTKGNAVDEVPLISVYC